MVARAQFAGMALGQQIEPTFVSGPPPLPHTQRSPMALPTAAGVFGDVVVEENIV